jgi:hypothetical protein
MLIAGVDGVILIAKKKYIPDTQGLIDKRLTTDLIIFFAMFSLFFYCLTLYSTKGDTPFRIFSATLIIALLLLVWSRRYWPVIVVVLFSLFTIPSFIEMFNATQKGNFSYDSALIEKTKKGLEQFVTYDPVASDPWCNTLMMPSTIEDYRAYAVPAGIGITYYVPQFSNQKPPFPLKSKYVLLDQKEYDRLAETEQQRLQLLVTLPESILFRNLDSPCN